MVNPDRTLLHELVEADETEVPLRSKHDPIAHYGIPNVGKLLIIGAVELDEVGHPQRLRLEPLADKTGPSVRGFIGRVVGRGATVVSDGLQHTGSSPSTTTSARSSATWRPTSS